MTEQYTPPHSSPLVLIPVDPAIERYMLGLTNHNDGNFDAFINPVRDGVIVARKKLL